MSRRASGLPKERHHVHLTQGFWQRLGELYSSQGITPSSVIDQLVGHHIRRVEEKANVKAKEVIEDEVEISNE